MIITDLSRRLDKLAGICIVAIMVLVVGNIILSNIFDMSILGTYEYVGFLTAALIGLSLSNCAIQNGHITVDFIADRLPAKFKKPLDIIINGTALSFWLLVAWHVAKYANSLRLSNVVSPTTEMPFYIIIYFVAFGFLMLGLSILLKLIESINRTVDNK